MTNNPRKTCILFLWLVLLACLITAASSSMVSRWQNEAKNHTILSVADYEKFMETAYQTHQTQEELFAQLKEAGVHAIGVKEISLRQLAEDGKISLQEYGEFLSTLQVSDPALYTQIQADLVSSAVNPMTLVAVTQDEYTAAFLTERLGARLAADEWTLLSQGNRSFFFIHCELAPLNLNVKGDTELDMRLGFDCDLIHQLQAHQGFDIVLRPGAAIGSNQDYLQEYEQVIRDYHVKTVVFSNTVLKATPEDIDYFADLIQKYGLTIGVVENSNQILYLKQDGLDDLMQKTDYPINRTYSTSSDDFVKQKSDRYYRWVRAVVDRGLRIMYIQPFNDATKLASENLKDSFEVIQDFHTTMLEKGFQVTGDLPTLDASRPGKANRTFLAVSLVAGVLLYGAYLLRWRNRTLWLLSLLGILGAVGLNLLPMDWTKVYALGAAILYPTLSGLLVLLYLRNHPKTHWLPKTIVSLVLLLAVNALGMVTLVSSLSDLRYIMYVKTFSGVKISFMIPLLLFMLNYLIVFHRGQGLSNTLVRLSQTHPTYLVLAIGAVFLVALYIYLGRSGNDSGITVSSLELRVREILEMVFLARPRFKEILIGYPCLMMMVYLYHRYRYSLLLLPLGLGMMMGSISMTNTFCHVFAAIQISASRTLAGLLVGVIIGIGCLAALRILENILFHFHPQLKKFVFDSKKKMRS